MSNIKPYDFMVKYTPQSDWIDGHGILVAFALFFGGVAGGLYLVALYFDITLGMFIAMLLAMVTGLIDMLHLSKPQRAWRMVFRPSSSWITRGFIVIALFIGAAAIQLALGQWAPGGAETFFKGVAAVLAFCVAIYSGFVLGYVGAIKLWNSAVVPILFVVAGVSGGLAILLLISSGESATTIVNMARFSLMALGAYAVSIFIYLWGTSYGSTDAVDSLKRILKGNIALVFWIGVVMLGIVIPIVLMTPFVLSANASTVACSVGAICIIFGGIFLRYCILKAGVYKPLLPAE